MSSDQYRIDSHKLHFHPDRVARWLAGETVAPIYMEVSPSGGCNHRCGFCGMDFMGYQPRLLPADVWRERLAELGRAGLRSIMYAGEGEPFIHPQMAEIAETTKKSGIDVAFTTNGVLLTPARAEAVPPHTSWIKVSCNAGSPENYARIHGTKAGDFETTLSNLAEAVQIRSARKSACTLGAQMVLLPENRREAAPLAARLRDIGLDYLVIKPYSVHRQSEKTAYLELSYGDCRDLAEELEKFNTSSFKVIFRHEALARREEKNHVYGRCQALPFWGYVDSGGSMWGCLRHIGEENFLYGNLVESTAEEVLAGPARREKMARCAASLDIADCRVDCRMDPVNAYLWELKRPGPHVNFI